MTIRSGRPSPGIAARIALIGVVVAVVTAAGMATAPDHDAVPRWIPSNPATSAGWPVGTFGCDSDPWTQYTYPEATRPGDAIEAKSTPAVRGKAYCFELGHCGLQDIVDFDGSFWEVAGWDSPESPSSLVNGSAGAIRLVGADDAEFTDWAPGRVVGRFKTGLVNYDWEWGARVTLRRIDGPIVPPPCY